MRNIRLTLQYDGTDYAGWQRQANEPTIQEKVTRALEKITGEKITLHGSGRTDSGVHAQGQTANFLTSSTAPLRAFVMGLNSLLPDDITVSRADLMPEDFNSRRSATGKCYRYRIRNSKTPSALWRRVSWWVGRPLDLKAMRNGAKPLIGIHDFNAFRSSGCDAAHAVREIYSIDISEGEELVSITVRGSGFLRNMVRIIAGTLTDVGDGKLPVESVAAALTSLDRTKAGVTAPPQGLSLAEVYYDEEPLESYP